MSTLRDRNRTQLAFTSHYTQSIFGTLLTDQTWVHNDTSHLVDVIGDPKPYPDHPMTLEHLSHKVAPLNGVSIEGAWVTTFSNVWPNLSFPSHLSLDMPAANAGMVTNVIARSNPSRPVVAPLTLLQDIKDIPKQLKEFGDQVKPSRMRDGSYAPKGLNPKDIGNIHLGIQFGWLPLIEDVKKVVNFGSYTHKRAKEFKRLYESPSGQHSTIQLGTAAASSDDGLVDISTDHGHYIRSRASRMTTAKRWGTTRWIPHSYPPVSNRDAFYLAQAQRASAGLTVEGTLQGAWDLIPWTWLVDWFSNVGDFALLNSNTVPASWTSACIMTRVETVQTFKPEQIVSSVKGGGGYLSRLTLSRYTAGALLDLHVPFLDPGRLSILGALYVQRFKP